ncbi:XRE family transcriptional regulator [Opitutaceae bacterium EW11]|nr:XRE family transcriptional regulator [Opitutaceae bacterium EW11]
MPNLARAENLPGRRLAQIRQARGKTQAGLAAELGVSRQFLSQMEAGRVLPNVLIALRTAALLGTTVEDLFGEAAAERERSPHVELVDAALSPGARLRVGRVGKSWIAFAADTPRSMAAGFEAADAVLLEDSAARFLKPAGTVAANLLLAGCDPALALLQSAKTEGGGRYHWVDCGSGHALDLLSAGRVHVAGIHYAGANGSGNLREVRLRDRERDWALVRFTRWEQGWIVRRDPARPFTGLAELRTGAWKLANRDRSTAARRWFDQQLSRARIAEADIPGYDSDAGSALEAAQAIAAGRADVMVGPQALAVAHGLGFVPAEAVDFDLVAPAQWWRSPSGEQLKEHLAELAAEGVLTSLPGYVPTEAGIGRSR